MDLIALVCLFIVFALLLADQILSRRASGRERRHRERVQAREQRLRAEWDARQDMPPLR